MSVHDTKEYGKVKKALGIPEDEPIFVLRGQDALALSTLARYRNFAAQIEQPPNEEWFASLDSHVEEFQTWQTENRKSVKVPD